MLAEDRKEVRMSRSVAMERVMAYPREKVWRALTQGVVIDGWLTPDDFEPQLGRRFRFTAQPHWDGVMRRTAFGRPHP
jgi:uncharacterized protein YndB with AHSA1/START domain